MFPFKRSCTKPFVFWSFAILLGSGIFTPSSWAQSQVLTNSSNFRNQFHRNLQGQCSTSSILCNPRTANPGGGQINGPQSLQRVDAVAPGEVRCVSGFGTADGDSPGSIPTGGNDLCLTTAGVLWAGGARNMDAGDCGVTDFCSTFFVNTGFPLMPEGADTQFGVGAKASNGFDIGGTANDNFVPAGASTGLIDVTFRHDFKDTQTVGAGDDCANFDNNCRSSFKISWSAPKPPSCTGCPPTLTGNKFSSVPTFDGMGNLTGRQHTIEYGHTQRWSSAITGNEGSTGLGRGDGDLMQEFIISFRVDATTDLNGNLIGNPTGSYFIQLGRLNGTDVDSVGGVTVMSTESGTFSTVVSGLSATPVPADVPAVTVTLTQDGLTEGAGGELGCQHDSNGVTCIQRSATFTPP